MKMSLEKHYTVNEACRLLGITAWTLRRWDKLGKIRVVRTVGGRRRVPESEIKRLLGLKVTEPSGKVAIYARVSSSDQKDDLQRQRDRLLNYAKRREYEVVEVLTDVASGLNEKRRGLAKAFKLAEKGKIGRLIVEHKDRLARFGFNYLKRFFNSYGVAVEVTDQAHASPQRELVEDMLAIVTSFAGRLYGQRSHRARRVVEGVRKLIA